MDILIYIHISKNRGGNIYTVPLYFSRGGGAKDILPLSNLLTLCKHCHKK